MVPAANVSTLRLTTEDDQHQWSVCRRLSTHASIVYTAMMLVRVVAHKEASGDTTRAQDAGLASGMAAQHWLWPLCIYQGARGD